jgi:hypothetical protein
MSFKIGPGRVPQGSANLSRQRKVNRISQTKKGHMRQAVNNLNPPLFLLLPSTITKGHGGPLEVPTSSRCFDHAAISFSLRVHYRVGTLSVLVLANTCTGCGSASKPASISLHLRSSV